MKKPLYKRIPLYTLTALLALLSPFYIQLNAKAAAPDTGSGYVTGYYASWAAAKGYTPDKVPASQLTHLNYAFAGIDPKTLTIIPGNPALDMNNFRELRALKQTYPHLKTLIAVGGWDYSTYFSDAAATEENRERFAQSCVDFIMQHGFDGVDLDWEYPVSGGPAGSIHRPEDRQNFTLLLNTLRQKLNAAGAQSNRYYYLTIAGAAGSDYLSKIEPTQVASLVDYIFVMTYDLHGPWDSYADLNAPLYTPSAASVQYKTSVADSIAAYQRSGIAASKLVLGMPLYGYVYQQVAADNNGLFSSFSSAKAVSYDTLCAMYLPAPAFSSHNHPEAGVPYLYGNNTFISYDDPASIQAKALYAKNAGLGGIGVWELSQDSSGVLLSTAVSALKK